jgi:PKD repeat protein
VIPAVNEIVTFNASASYDQDSNIVSYNWSFGDGNLVDSTEAIITHSYVSVGGYTVNLTVTDDEGATNKMPRVIKVFPDVPYLDTEAGTYPSIPGTHNGTITMTHSISVTKARGVDTGDTAALNRNEAMRRKRDPLKRLSGS